MLGTREDDNSFVTSDRLTDRQELVCLLRCLVFFLVCAVLLICVFWGRGGSSVSCVCLVLFFSACYGTDTESGRAELWLESTFPFSICIRTSHPVFVVSSEICTLFMRNSLFTSLSGLALRLFSEIILRQPSFILFFKINKSRSNPRSFVWNHGFANGA